MSQGDTTGNAKRPWKSILAVLAFTRFSDWLAAHASDEHPDGTTARPSLTARVLQAASRAGGAAIVTAVLSQAKDRNRRLSSIRNAIAPAGSVARSGSPGGFSGSPGGFSGASAARPDKAMQLATRSVASLTDSLQGASSPDQLPRSRNQIATTLAILEQAQAAPATDSGSRNAIDARETPQNAAGDASRPKVEPLLSGSSSLPDSGNTARQNAGLPVSSIATLDNGMPGQSARIVGRAESAIMRARAFVTRKPLLDASQAADTLGLDAEEFEKLHQQTLISGHVANTSQGPLFAPARVLAGGASRPKSFTTDPVQHPVSSSLSGNAEKSLPTVPALTQASAAPRSGILSRIGSGIRQRLQLASVPIAGDDTGTSPAVPRTPQIAAESSPPVAMTGRLDPLKKSVSDSTGRESSSISRSGILSRIGSGIRQRLQIPILPLPRRGMRGALAAVGNANAASIVTAQMQTRSQASPVSPLATAVQATVSRWMGPAASSVVGTRPAVSASQQAMSDAADALVPNSPAPNKQPVVGTRPAVSPRMLDEVRAALRKFGYPSSEVNWRVQAGSSALTDQTPDVASLIRESIRAKSPTAASAASRPTSGVTSTASVPPAASAGSRPPSSSVPSAGGSGGGSLPPNTPPEPPEPPDDDHRRPGKGRRPESRGHHHRRHSAWLQEDTVMMMPRWLHRPLRQLRRLPAPSRRTRVVARRAARRAMSAISKTRAGATALRVAGRAVPVVGRFAAGALAGTTGGMMGGAIGSAGVAGAVMGGATLAATFVGLAALIAGTVMMAIKGFAEKIAESNRHLAQYNGSIATAFAQLEVSRHHRGIEQASHLQGSARYAVKGLDRLEEALLPMQTIAQGLWNNVGGFLANGAAAVIETGNDVASGTMGAVTSAIAAMQEAVTTQLMRLNGMSQEQIDAEIEHQRKLEQIEENTRKDGLVPGMGTMTLMRLENPDFQKADKATGVIPGAMQPLWEKNL